MTISSNKRIARNTIFLYGRMVISILISLYTSRVVLQVLGVDDFGVYGVVGGVVGALGFLNASMSGATSRFITFELRDGNEKRLNDTFCSAMIIHMAIAGIVLIISETAGLWFLNTKLVIPAETMATANWVFQISIISAMISITQLPYTACIIAHENMDIYAYLEILNVSLKLAIVFLLEALPGNKLLIYALLVLAVSTVVALLYRYYAFRHFSECRFHWTINKSLIKPMLKFSFADLYGNLCGMSFYQGTAFILNIFFGVAVNAGNAIANTVSGIMVGLSDNVTTAYRPHIIKQYAAGDYIGMSDSIKTGSMLVLLLSALICIPAFIYMPAIIDAWLGEEPPYTVIFCRLLIIYCMMGQINAYLVIAIHATGNIKWLSFGGGTLYLLTLPAMYFVFKMGYPPYMAYIVHIISRILIIVLNLIIARNLIPKLNLRPFIFKCLRTCLVIGLSFAVCLFLSRYMTFDLLSAVLVALLDTTILGVFAFLLLFSNNERTFICSKIRRLPCLNKK